MTPSVSIVIRVRDEADFLRQCLDAIKKQDYPPFEIVVVDNESRDDSRLLAVEAGAKVISIARGAFSYGRALNLGIRASSGEVALLLSAHSLPVGRNFIREAVAPFADERVAAVRCTHVLNRHDVEHWACPQSLEWPISLEEVALRGPVACASAIRRSVWEKVPFDERLAAVEDKFWAFEVLRRGLRVAQGPALYLYLRDRRLLESVKILHRDRLVFYEEAGRYFPAPPLFSDLMRMLFLQLPKRTLRQAVHHILLYFRLKSIPWHARRHMQTAPSGDKTIPSL